MYFYLYELKNVSQIFKFLFQIGDINVFVLHGVYFSKYVQLKSSFSDKKHQWWNLRYTLAEKLSKINTGKYSIFKKNSILLKSWSSGRLFIMQNYTEKANEDEYLTAENVIFFSFFEFMVRTCSFFIKDIFILWP